MDELEILGRLRDIRLPPPLPLWPPAPGWWLLLAAVLIGLGWGLWRLRRRGRLRRAALAELGRLERRYRADGDALALAAGLSILLRRAALASGPRAAVAGLSGEAWLVWLDQGRGGGFASSPAGRALLTLPFGGGGGEHAPALIAMVRHWLRMRT